MTSKTHIRVKFVHRGLSKESTPQWLRMFPSRNPVWGDCCFIFDRDEQNYDWLVVYNDLRAQQGKGRSTARIKLHCPPEHTLLITTEPSSISTYGSDFLNQFGYVLTGQEDWAIKHPGKILSQPALRWFYGDARGGGKLLDYDFISTHPPENKTRTLSTVCSAKAQKHTMHYKRVQFVEKMCIALPELDRFGWGIREVDDKAETLDAYRYHIAIENHVCDHWWTEKLADPFLGMALPFYFGAPNANDYFPEESFIPIDIFNFDRSLETIQKAIENDEYTKRFSAIREARRLILEKYNTFAVLSELITERHTSSKPTLPDFHIYTRQALRRNPVKAVRAGLEKSAMRAKTLFNQRRKTDEP